MAVFSVYGILAVCGGACVPFGSTAGYEGGKSVFHGVYGLYQEFFLGAVNGGYGGLRIGSGRVRVLAGAAFGCGDRRLCPFPDFGLDGVSEIRVEWGRSVKMNSLAVS